MKDKGDHNHNDWSYKIWVTDKMADHQEKQSYKDHNHHSWAVPAEPGVQGHKDGHSGWHSQNYEQQTQQANNNSTAHKDHNRTMQTSSIGGTANW